MPLETEIEADRYETTHFRTLGWIGAVCFTLAPPTFLYEWWLTFYTTAMEENPTINVFMAISAILSFASVPLLIAGRRKRISTSPTVDRLPARLGAMRNRAADPAAAPRPGRAPL